MDLPGTEHLLGRLVLLKLAAPVVDMGLISGRPSYADRQAAASERSRRIKTHWDRRGQEQASRRAIQFQGAQNRTAARKPAPADLGTYRPGSTPMKGATGTATMEQRRRSPEYQAMLAKNYSANGLPAPAAPGAQTPSLEAHTAANDFRRDAGTGVSSAVSTWQNRGRMPAQATAPVTPQVQTAGSPVQTQQPPTPPGPAPAASASAMPQTSVPAKGLEKGLDGLMPVAKKAFAVSFYNRVGGTK